MKNTTLGISGIKVSRLGIGTGTADRSGKLCQSAINENEFARILLYALDKGIFFWDTALQYDTHRHVACALWQINRREVVLSTKLTTETYSETEQAVERSLRELWTDFIDFCLLHAVRGKKDFQRRMDALNMLVKAKQAGKIRSIGISSHNLESLDEALEMIEIEGVWPDPEKNIITKVDQQETLRMISKLHAQGKGIVGMKILAENRLAHDPRKAIAYIMSFQCVHSFIIGIENTHEIDVNCGIIDDIERNLTQNSTLN
jgi:predicted aldo/keto reductase-like oxidoreductase